MICIVPAISILPLASRAGLISSVNSARKRWFSQPHDAGAVDGAVEMPREASQQRIRQRLPAEEGHRNSAAVILVDQHADMGATLERLAQFSWAHPDRSKSVRPYARCGFPSAIGRCAQYLAVGRAPRCRDCRWSRRLRAVPNSPDVRRKSVPACHRPTACETARYLVAQVRCALASDAPDHSSIAGQGAQTPHPCGRDCPSIRAGSRRFPASDFSGNAATRLARPIRFSGSRGPMRRIIASAEICHRVRIGQTHGLEYANRKGANERVACALEAAPQAAEQRASSQYAHMSIAHDFSEFRPHFSGSRARNSR